MCRHSPETSFSPCCHPEERPCLGTQSPPAGPGATIPRCGAGLCSGAAAAFQLLRFGCLQDLGRGTVEKRKSFRFLPVLPGVPPARRTPLHTGWGSTARR